MFKELIEDLKSDIIDKNNKDSKIIENNIIEKKNSHDIFNISLFEEELRERSELKNRSYLTTSTNISAYDIAHNCIMQTIKKLLNHPIESYSDTWLPVMMKQVIGDAIHEFIQSSKQFTEGEVSIKVPSIKFSGRIDNIIDDNILVEIKSCTFEDYNKIIKTKKPRIGDFYQVMVYKYILENYIKEIKTCGEKTRTQLPALENYKIDTLQLIYVANDICSSEMESISSAFKFIKELKRLFDSSNNKFYFINCITIKTDTFDCVPYINWIDKKIKRINWYITNDRLPSKDDEFIDRKKCFFCIYKKYCEVK